MKQGTVRRDYHTAHNVLRAKAKLRPGKQTAEGDLQQTVLSERYYLSDAHFLVGFESDDMELLLSLDAALSNPFSPSRSESVCDKWVNPLFHSWLVRRKQSNTGQRFANGL
ncbi:type I-E CRISPR-associated protein Cas5/CasD [Fibrella aquatica]|jgi:CRISPR-associated protein (Cas_Cas5)|uniref:type I-E CRISPR-associated protein Cas5/CasD n=1 Tax=Fibrella aquatica TaxID=3242487 RepID=UPI003522ED44